MAAVRLKHLRRKAEPAVTMRRMADALGMPPSSYGRYEDPAAFKKRHLPLALAKKIAAVLADHGVDPREVLSLAGLDEDHQLPSLSAGEDAWLELYRILSPHQRQLLQQVATEMRAA